MTTISRVLYSAALLVVGIAISTAAQAQYWHDPATGEYTFLPKEDHDIPTRNKVILFNSAGQPKDEFYYVADKTTVNYIGLKGETGKLPLFKSYVGQAWLADGCDTALCNDDMRLALQRGEKVTQFAFAPYAVPYSGSTRKGSTGRIDLHNVDIPHSIGPIISVEIETSGNYKWQIDKMIVDGRSFDFSDATERMIKRYSTHFILGKSNGNYQQRSQGYNSVISNFQFSYGSRGAVVLRPDVLPKGDLSVGYQGLGAQDYVEPLLKEQNKTVTVRVKFDDTAKGNSAAQIGPKVDVTLISGKVASKTVTTDGPLLFDDRYVSFRVPGDFKVTAIDVSLAKSSLAAKIKEVGVLVEEGLGQEVVFHDSAYLSSEGRPSDRLTRFGNKGAGLTLAEIITPEGVNALRARSHDDIFAPLAAGPAEEVLLRKLRKELKVLGRYDFETWFLFSGESLGSAATLTSHQIVSEADAVIGRIASSEERNLWNISLRSKFEQLVNDRSIALGFIERIERLAEDHRKVVVAEMAAAREFLSLDAKATVAIPIASDGETNNFSTFAGTLGTALSFVEATGIASPGTAAMLTAIGQVISISSAVDDLNLTGTNSAFGNPPQVVNTVGKQNELRVAFGGRTLSYYDDYEQMRDWLWALRHLAMRDLSVIEELALYDVNFTNYLANNFSKSLMDADLLAGFEKRGKLAVRRDIINDFLPIRGVLYGTSLKCCNEGNALRDLSRLMFPDGQTWDAERWIKRPDAVPEDVLALSGLIYNGDTLPWEDRKKNITDWFKSERDDGYPRKLVEAWRLAFGEVGQEPVVASSVEHNGISTWSYLREVLRPSDIFSLIQGKEFLVSREEMICDADDSKWGGACYSPFNTVEVLGKLPKWRVPLRGGEGISVLSVGGRVPENARNVTSWRYVQFDSDYKFEFDMFVYGPDGQAELSTLVPTAWVGLHNGVGFVESD